MAYLAHLGRAAARPDPVSLDEFIELPEEDLYRLELAAGDLVREPAPGLRHGRVASRLTRILFEATHGSGHGEVWIPRRAR